MSENENLDANVGGENKRPTFLTVLCILTFVGSGLGLLGGLLGLVGVGALSSMSSVAGDSLLWVGVGLVSSALCLFGAIQMFGLKKMGFTLYLAGSALAIIAGIVSTISATSRTNSALNTIRDANSQYGGMDADSIEAMNQFSNAASGMASGMIWAGTIFSILITVAFVLMYNANRKHLVN